MNVTVNCCLSENVSMSALRLTGQCSFFYFKFCPFKSHLTATTYPSPSHTESHYFGIWNCLFGPLLLVATRCGRLCLSLQDLWGKSSIWCRFNPKPHSLLLLDWGGPSRRQTRATHKERTQSREVGPLELHKRAFYLDWVNENMSLQSRHEDILYVLKG